MEDLMIRTPNTQAHRRKILNRDDGVSFRSGSKPKTGVEIGE